MNQKKTSSDQKLNKNPVFSVRCAHKSQLSVVNTYNFVKRSSRPVEMNHPAIFITFVFALFSSYSTADEEALQLKSSSEDEVRGCYKHNQTLAVCFDVKKGSIKIQKSSGEGIVYYKELGPEMFLYKVLDKAFITG